MNTNEVLIESATGNKIGIATIKKFSSSEIFKNSFKKLLIFLIAAILSVFVPVLHFVLVPLFILLAVFFFFQARKLPYKIIDAKVNCPRCQKEFSLNNLAVDWPHMEKCPFCLSNFQIQSQ